MARLIYIWQTTPESLVRSIAWILLALISVFLLLLYKRAIRTTAASCPRCGYNLTGLTGDTCTECGAKLRRTGVMPPGRWPMTFFLRIGLWTLWLLCAATVAHPWIVTLSSPGNLLATRTLQLPQSGGYVGVVITGRAKSGLWGIRQPDYLTIMTWMHDDRSIPDLTRDRRGRSLLVDTRRCVAHILDETDQPTGPELLCGNSDASKSILLWFRANDIPGDPALLEAEASELARMLQERSFVAQTLDHREHGRVPTLASPLLLQKKSAAFGDIAYSVDFNPLDSTWIEADIAASWVLLWLAGCTAVILMTWKGRRRMKHAAATLLGDKRITHQA